MDCLKGKWEYREMRLLQAVQCAIYIAFSSFKVLKDQGILDSSVDEKVKRDIVHTRVVNALKRMVAEGVIYAFEFRYDPTLWQARKFKLAELSIEPTPTPDYWKLRLDFDRGVADGVSVWSPPEKKWTPVDVTKIELEVEG